eukprot:CAMPEP_0182534010 /NCGR_PEP_ID=MMETSP1323-20130603/14871_1 /TAXON_ID=236787 /ORGANISM="Florenciella parvula, Strain RCC1693" /LENGTH=249 /DNA_ID=CAMNT_0024743973 /DNA_START=171 /DNA_END=917 /DNA_ORIENTATION=+
MSGFSFGGGPPQPDGHPGDDGEPGGQAGGQADAPLIMLTNAPWSQMSVVRLPSADHAHAHDRGSGRGGGGGGGGDAEDGEELDGTDLTPLLLSGMHRDVKWRRTPPGTAGPGAATSAHRLMLQRDHILQGAIDMAIATAIATATAAATATATATPEHAAAPAAAPGSVPVVDASHLSMAEQAALYGGPHMKDRATTRAYLLDLAVHAVHGEQHPLADSILIAGHHAYYVHRCVVAHHCEWLHAAWAFKD